MNLDNIFQHFPITAVYLFGSRGRDEEDTKSDYDFGILLNEGITPLEYVNIKFSLLKELIRYLKEPVDVIIINHRDVSLSLKFRIIKEGKVIYEKDGLIRSRFEENVLSLYLDRKYYYQRHITEVIKNIASGGLLD